MNRLDYYFRQRVTEAELDKGFTYCEDADHAQWADADFDGIYNGLTVTENTVPNLTVDVEGGVAYDGDGQRIAFATTQNLDCAVDYNDISTAVLNIGNEKWLSIQLGFDRTLSDPRTDGNSETVYFERAESFVLRVVQGAEAPIGTATRPALDPDYVLLADVLLNYGETAINDSDIDTTRRQWQFRQSGAAYYGARGTMREVVQDIYDILNSISTGGGLVAATSVSYAGGPNWYNGTTNPATTAEDQLDKIVADLALCHILLGSGSAKIGSYAYTGSPSSLPTGSVRDQLVALLDAVNARGVLDAVNAWADVNTFSSNIVADDGISLACASIASPRIYAEYDSGADSYVLIKKTLLKSGATNHRIVRHYRTHYMEVITINAEYTYGSPTWQADDNTQQAIQITRHALYGEQHWYKQNTSSNWSSWDDNAAAMVRGHKTIVFDDADSFDNIAGDSNWHAITKDSGATTLGVTFPALPNYTKLAVHLKSGLRNPTLGSGAVYARCTVYTTEDPTWREVPGTLAYWPWERIGVTDIYAPGPFALMGEYSLPYSATHHTNVQVRAEVRCTGSATTYIGDGDSFLAVNALQLA
jgi:hypothetical protein